MSIERCGRCRLQSVKIMNEGTNWISPNNVYWKHDVERSESVKIILHGNAEFEAKDVVLEVRLLRIMQNFFTLLFI
jgi:UTP---glucose-1-phosphate uridylyltransferase